MAAEVESQEPSQDEAHNNIMLDTTISESPISGLTASPLPKTPIAPTVIVDEPSDSGSEYSDDDDDFQSPDNSRPTSIEPQPEPETSYDTVNEGDETGQEQQAESIPDGHSPEPTSPAPAEETQPDVLELPETDTEEPKAQPEPVDSDSSVESTSKARSSSVFEDVPLEEEKPASESPVDATVDVIGRKESIHTAAADTSSLEGTTEDSMADHQGRANEVSSRPDSPDGSDYTGSPPQSPSTPSFPISPMTPQEAHMSIDSLQSIALSESSLDYDHLSSDQVEDVLATPRVRSVRHLRKPSSLEIVQNTWGPPTRQETLFDTSKDEPLDTPVVGPDEENDDTLMDTTSAWRSESTTSLPTFKRDSGSSGSDVELNWHALDRNEEQEKEDRDLPEGAEDESTAFLLARLEQENAKFSADPKSATGGTSAIPKHMARIRSQSRPPSMAHLKKLVSKQETPSIRYSMASDTTEQAGVDDDPPPMTELEFWAALVQDYPSTATRLPTLTTTKIRAGIPLPLRGVVWASMSGARDKTLEEAFDKLQNEQSPYEGIINKDVGRSFPGVELFRDAEGEGQKMLGRVLKCFSLHDKDIGYCQGMGFLVGPLLLNMGEKEAFCVLVRYAHY
jgi:hypothetical protein